MNGDMGLGFTLFGSGMSWFLPGQAVSEIDAAPILFPIPESGRVRTIPTADFPRHRWHGFRFVNGKIDVTGGLDNAFQWFIRVFR